MPGLPVFWMNETSGRLRDVVRKFFDPEANLDEEELRLLKWYVGQWVAAMPYPPHGWRELLEACRNESELHLFILDELLPMSIDPF